jgi:hypothetical protein
MITIWTPGGGEGWPPLERKGVQWRSTPRQGSTSHHRAGRKCCLARVLPLRACFVPGMSLRMMSAVSPRRASVPVACDASLLHIVLSSKPSLPTSAASGVQAAPQVGLAKCNALLLWLAHLAVLAVYGQLSASVSCCCQCCACLVVASAQVLPICRCCVVR